MKDKDKSKRELEIMQEGFLFYFETLNVRTKNVLRRIGIDSFQLFYDKMIIPENETELADIHNCGEKTIQEILTFRSNVRLFSKLFAENANNSDQCFEQENLLFKFLVSMSHTDISNLLDANGINNLDKYRAADLWKTLPEENNTSLIDFNNKLTSILTNYKNKFIGIFTLLHIAIFELNNFRSIEKDIISSYFNYSSIHPKETLTSISLRYCLSLERVRMIGAKIQRNLPTFFAKFSYSKYMWEKYFKGEYFLVNKEIVDSINSNEGTHFHSSFINLFLSSLNNTGYKFFKVYAEKYILKGIFISESLIFNFEKCFDLLTNINDKTRDTDIQIKVESLLQKYGYNTGVITKEQLTGILKLFTELLNSDNNKIVIASDYIIFRRNIPKLLQEYLIEILRENKKPLHYSELFRAVQNKVDKLVLSRVRSTIHESPEIFGQRGSGRYGLKEWGGYFGSIGDIAEHYLLDKGKPVEYKELAEFLRKELNINGNSINTLLFHYEREERFVKLDNKKVGLKIWQIPYINNQ